MLTKTLSSKSGGFNMSSLTPSPNLPIYGINEHKYTLRADCRKWRNLAVKALKTRDTALVATVAVAILNDSTAKTDAVLMGGWAGVYGIVAAISCNPFLGGVGGIFALKAGTDIYAVRENQKTINSCMNMLFMHYPKKTRFSSFQKELLEIRDGNIYKKIKHVFHKHGLHSSGLKELDLREKQQQISQHKNRPLRKKMIERYEHQIAKQIQNDGVSEEVRRLFVEVWLKL